MNGIYTYNSTSPARSRYKKQAVSPVGVDSHPRRLPSQRHVFRRYMGFSRIGAYCVAGALILTMSALNAHASQPPPTLDMLVHDLASTDNARQARARQLLPRMGAEAAVKMLPLLADERHQVSFAALRVLEDLCHETTAHGSSEDQELVARAMFSLLETERSVALKQIGLRLLPLAAREEHDLTPAARLLRDAGLREKARAALSDVRTENALKILCDALTGAEAAFRVDLLRAIYLFPGTMNKSPVAPLLHDPSPAVRAAALRALANTGDPSFLSDARRVCASVDNDAAFEAWDGFLMLTDTVAARGGRWESVMAAYREILDTSPHTLVQGGAMVGLGRFGDETAVPAIMAALDREGGETLEPAALEAFRNLFGRNAHAALRDAFHEASPTMRVGLLALYGDKADPIFLEVLQAQAVSDEPVLRRAALAALRDARFPESTELFADMLVDASDAAAAVAQQLDLAADSLLDMALHLEQRGDGDGAGRAYLALYRHAPDEETRRQALDGVRRFPTPEAFDIVLDALAAGDLETLPVSAMMGVALNAIEGGREAEGRKILDDLMPRLRSTNDVGAAINALAPRGPNPAFIRAMGIVNQWHMIGPFPWRPATGFSERFINEPDIALDASHVVNGETLNWTQVSTECPTGLFDLSAVIGAVENAVAFAHTRIKVDGACEAQLRIGSDDGVRVWVNGEHVFEIDADRGYQLDENSIPITLNKGCNDILVQITQLLGGWALGARITQPDGAHLAFTFCD